MRGLAIEAQRFQLAMRGNEQRAAGSFVGAARFDADQAIFHQVNAADAVRGGDFIQSVEQRDRAQGLSVD